MAASTVIRALALVALLANHVEAGAWLTIDAIRAGTELDRRGPDGGASGVPGGRYEAGDPPRKHEPFMTIGAGPDRTAAVTVRGPGGSTEPPHPQTPEHHTSNIWITDQSGQVVCEAGFDGSETHAELKCILPASVTQAQAHELCNKHGLWSGPALGVDQPPLGV